MNGYTTGILVTLMLITFAGLMAWFCVEDYNATQDRNRRLRAVLGKPFVLAGKTYTSTGCDWFGELTCVGADGSEIRVSVTAAENLIEASKGH